MFARRFGAKSGRGLTAIILAIVLAGGTVGGCVHRYGPITAVRPAIQPRVPAADAADSLFWRTFHAGEYDSIPRALVAAKAAYLQNPTDSRVAARVAFLHAWRLAERARIPRMSPSITDDIFLARRYFDQSILYEPDPDPRVHGFGAVFRMSEGTLHRDPALWEDGLRRGRKAIEAWPDFNLFTIGYALSGQPDTSAHFSEGLEMQWQNLESCARRKMDRTNPSAEPALASLRTETDPRKIRACTNTWIAPHNMEGFLLNMGDMLVKSGDWQLGQKVYRMAESVDGYAQWPYKQLLQDRIRIAEQNVVEFRKPDGPIMLRSRVACMACHQAK